MTTPAEANNHRIWMDRIDGYIYMNRNQKKKAKAKWRMNNCVENTSFTLVNKDSYPAVTGQGNLNGFIRFSNAYSDYMRRMFEDPTPPTPIGEDEMYNNETTTQRNHLFYRLRDIHCTKNTDLNRAFGITDDETPSNLKEFVDRILAGKYVLPEQPEQRSYWNVSEDIRWRDPAKKADLEGYDAASAKLDKAYADAADEIKIFAPEKGLEVLRAFESATFH